MFNFLKAGKVNLNVEIDRPSGLYFPGETVHAKISLSSDKDLKFQEGRVALLYQEKYQYRTTHHRTDSKGVSHSEVELRWQTNDQEIFRCVFLNETNLPAGTTQNFEFEAQIPASAPPTFPGEIIQVRWMVKATLDRKLINDINMEASLVVLNASSGAQTPGQFGQSKEPEEAQLILELPGTEWVAGDVIDGTLLVISQKNFDATEVRVELVQTEWVPYDRGNQKDHAIAVKVAGKTKFTTRETLRFPFHVQIPQPCSPSGSTNNWSVSWKINGILARLFRKDTAIEQEIKVYTSHPV